LSRSLKHEQYATTRADKGSNLYLQPMKRLLRIFGFRALAENSDPFLKRKIVGFIVKNSTSGEIVLREAYDVDHIKSARSIMVCSWYRKYLESRYDLHQFDVQDVRYNCKEAFDRDQG